jgi:hypothetical protein
MLSLQSARHGGEFRHQGFVNVTPRRQGHDSSDRRTIFVTHLSQQNLFNAIQRKLQVVHQQILKVADPGVKIVTIELIYVLDECFLKSSFLDRRISATGRALRADRPAR